MRRHGYSLVELLVALLILSVGIITMAGVMSQTTRVQGLALSRAELTAMAESKIEELRSLAVAMSSPPRALTVGIDTTDTAISASGRSYRRRWRVTAGPSASSRVEVQVMPATASRHEINTLTFTTLITVGE